MNEYSGESDTEEYLNKLKKIFLIVAILCIFMSCVNGRENSSSSDTTVNSTTPPSTTDTSNEMGAMMGDTSTLAKDSTK